MRHSEHLLETDAAMSCTGKRGEIRRLRRLGMPAQYAGILEEHKAVRTSVGL